MSIPQVFTDFNKNLTCQIEALAPNDDEADAQKRADPNYIQALELLKDQLYSKDSLSKQIISKTNFVILLRNLPEVGDTADVNNFKWFAGNYQWDELVKKLLDLESTTPLAIYLVPTLGQSDQGSLRHELTYNAFISPSGQVPFSYLVQRHPRPQQEGEDEELFAKSDICTFPTLDSLHLTWEKLMEFTNEQFEFLESEKSIDVFILKPTKSFQTSVKRLYQEKPERFKEWYETVVLNFLPLIPFPTKEGKLTHIPLVLIDPIETTPGSYTKLIHLVDLINEKFSTINFFTKEHIRAIKGVIRYWQYDPNSIANELVIFANNDHSIPKASKEFNNLFFSQLGATRDFIIEEILDKYLGIKRKSDDFEMYKGAPCEVEEEMEKYDMEIKKRFMNSKDDEKEKYIPIFNELKEMIQFWFDKANLTSLYNEFKTSISNAMNEMLSSASMTEYLRISQEENSNNNRNQWLADYYESKNPKPLLYCLWPTIYYSTGVLHQGEKNAILEQVEQFILKNVSTNTTLPDTRGKPIPPKAYPF